MRGGHAHLSVTNYLIISPVESSKLYHSSEPRVLSLCRAALAPPTDAQPWNCTLQKQAASALSGPYESGCAAACCLLVSCLMASSEFCERALSFCCDLLKQEAPCTHTKGPSDRRFLHGMPQQTSGYRKSVMAPQALHFFLAGALDAVNLHLPSLQRSAAHVVLECAFLPSAVVSAEPAELHFMEYQEG